MSTAWQRIAAGGPAAVVVVGAIGALLGVSVLRCFAPRHRRQHGGPARFFLGSALLLAGSAVGVGTMGASSPGNILQLAGLLALALGLVGMVGLVVFDLVLPRLRVDVPSIVQDLILVAAGTMVALGFLRLAGLDVLSLVTTSAVLTAVVGLALQSTIANVFSGLALQLDRTLRHGEWIEVGGRTGRILEIGWRSTRIQTKDGDIVFVPNGELVSREVVSIGRPSGAHRVAVRIGFHYRHPPNEVRRVLLGALRAIPGILTEPPPDCGPIEFGESAVVYALRYWIDDFAHETRMLEDVHTRVWYAARRADLEMPSPTRTVVSPHDAAAARVAADAHEEAEALRRVGVPVPFRRLEPARRRGCVRGIRRVDFARGEIVDADRADDVVYLIASGEVGVQPESDDACPDVHTLRAGEVLGGASWGERCTAHSDVALYRFDPRALEQAFADHPDLRAELAAITAAAATPPSGPYSTVAAGASDEPRRAGLRSLLRRR